MPSMDRPTTASTISRLIDSKTRIAGTRIADHFEEVKRLLGRFMVSNL
jgi:hypothetical protein